MKKISYKVVEECRKFILTGGVIVIYNSKGGYHSFTCQGRYKPTPLPITDRENILLQAHQAAGLRCILEPQVEAYICTLSSGQLSDIALICRKVGNKETYMEVYLCNTCIYCGSVSISFDKLEKLQQTAVKLCKEGVL